MPKKERMAYRKILLALRERLTGQMSVLRNESLTRNDSVVSEEDGTDAFDRQFALMLASSENDTVNEIDEALQRIETGYYGVCEECDKPIEKARLIALPSVRMCIKCKSNHEKMNISRRRIGY